MFKVIVLDDEPSAVQHVCSIIKTKCPEYEVVATAENGVEGMDKIRLLQPDLVISDVKMPLMNGIELVKKIKEEYACILTIIISGYQDFEYAKGAIQSGVTDYILKPVVPLNLQTVLSETAVKLKERYYNKRKKIIHQLCNGASCEDSLIAHYFTHKCYYGVIVRRNGLPRRFFKDNDLEIYSSMNELITIYGRDEMEELYIIPEELLSGKSFMEYLKKIQATAVSRDPYATIVYNKRAFGVSELQEQVKKLYRALDNVLVIGRIQVVSLDDISIGECCDKEENIGEIIKKIEYMLIEQHYEKLKKELRRLYLKWSGEGKNQLWMENISRRILYVVREHESDSVPLTEYEYMMEDAFFYAASVEELIDNLFEIIFKCVKGQEDHGKVDTPEFFNSVKSYLNVHMAESISLQQVCKIFAVSQTYLSKLFRKYENQSFNQYLTALRIEKAIRLMRADPELFIKDVAAMVGYSDQFYFSRIFRSYTSKSPSDYFGEL
ncbi:MAG TPA: response regulator [Clostridiales bacterium]|nr:response regulator [Clostridiales bacterium]